MVGALKVRVGTEWYTVGGGGVLTNVQPEPPPTPVPGDLWFDTDDPAVVVLTDAAINTAATTINTSLSTIRRKIFYLSDYVVGNGSNETAGIQAAVTAAAGGTLVCAANLSVGYAAPVAILSNTRIVGEAIFTQVAGTVNAAYPQALFYAVDRTGIRIKDITINCNFGAAPDGLLNGIFFRGVTNSLVERVTIDAVEHCGIYLSHGCVGVNVIGNTITGRTGLSGAAESGNPLIYVVSDIYGTNGTNGLMTEAGAVTFSTANSLPRVTRRNRIQGNTLLYGTHGISLINTMQNTIEGNICENNAHRGIILSGSAYNTVNANVVYLAGSTGIHMAWGCYHNTISANVVDQTVGLEGDGIKGYYGVSFNTITGNTVSNVPNAGVRLAVNVLGNVITDNSLYGCGSGTGGGVQLAGYLSGAYTNPTTYFPTSGNIVTNNRSVNCYNGFQLTSGISTVTLITRNTVALNIASGCTVGFKSDANALVLDNVRYMCHAFDNTTNYSDGGNTYRTANAYIVANDALVP